jgi:hypothetical protein
MSTVNPTIVTSVRSGGSDGRLEIENTRARQTERPATPFRSVLAGGVSMLMRGAEVATHVVGGPILAAAVRDARVGTAAAISGAGVGGQAGIGGSTAPGGGSAGGGVNTVEAMMSDGQASNMQLLALQQHIQQENQVFTTVSNVMRAKHDTAKAAVSNVRA